MVTDNTIPYFAWDRQLTVDDIHQKLSCPCDMEWLRLAAWILREARPKDVWDFLTPIQVRDHLDELMPFLGKKRNFWRFLIRSWHELGKL